MKLEQNMDDVLSTIEYLNDIADRMKKIPADTLPGHFITIMDDQPYTLYRDAYIKQLVEQAFGIDVELGTLTMVAKRMATPVSQQDIIVGEFTFVTMEEVS